MITTRADAPHHNPSLLPALSCPPPPSPPHNTQNATTTQQQQQKRSLIARQPLLFSNLVKVHARCPFLNIFFCHALCPLVSCWLSCAPTACINTHTWRICPHQEFWNLPGLVLHDQKPLHTLHLLLLCFALLFLVACMHGSQESESKALQSH